MSDDVKDSGGLDLDGTELFTWGAVEKIVEKATSTILAGVLPRKILERWIRADPDLRAEVLDLLRDPDIEDDQCFGLHEVAAVLLTRLATAPLPIEEPCQSTFVLAGTSYSCQLPCGHSGEHYCLEGRASISWTEDQE